MRTRVVFCFAWAAFAQVPNTHSFTWSPNPARLEVSGNVLTFTLPEQPKFRWILAADGTAAKNEVASGLARTANKPIPVVLGIDDVPAPVVSTTPSGVRIGQIDIGDRTLLLLVKTVPGVTLRVLSGHTEVFGKRLVGGVLLQDGKVLREGAAGWRDVVAVLAPRGTAQAGPEQMLRKDGDLAVSVSALKRNWISGEVTGCEGDLEVTGDLFPKLVIDQGGSVREVISARTLSDRCRSALLAWKFRPFEYDGRTMQAHGVVPLMRTPTRLHCPVLAR